MNERAKTREILVDAACAIVWTLVAVLSIRNLCIRISKG